MKEIIIVTAFFDIGRGNFKSEKRGNDQYFQYFKRWGRIKNRMICYTDSHMAEKVKQYRKECGLEERTEIVVIDDYLNLTPQLNNLYKRMQNIENSEYFKLFRIRSDAMENRANYDFVMFLKFWCMDDATNRFGLFKDTVAWMDFGFDHGGETFPNAEEFDFEWKYDFEDKIYFWYLDELDMKPIFESVRRLSTCIMGFTMIVPGTLVNFLWKEIYHAMEEIIDIGFIDDDQLLELMVYRKNPELFIVEKSTWFLPIKTVGGEHLTVRQSKQSLGTNKIITYMMLIKKMFRYLVQTVKCLRLHN